MHFSRVGRYLVAGLLFVSVAGVDAPASAEQAKSKKKAKTKPHREGDYGGVTPGAKHPWLKRPRRPTVTWTGFQVRDDDRARLFLQLSHDADYSQRLDKNNVLIVHLPGFRFGGKNAARRIDVRYFGTVLSVVRGHRVRSRRARRDTPATTSWHRDSGSGFETNSKQVRPRLRLKR